TSSPTIEIFALSLHDALPIYDQISEEGKFLKNVDRLSEKVDYLSTIKSNKIGCLTAVYSVKYFGKVYMENIAKRQDYTLWLKLRSEEHTSELQSRENLVCRLL